MVTNLPQAAAWAELSVRGCPTAQQVGTLRPRGLRCSEIQQAPSLLQTELRTHSSNPKE